MIARHYALHRGELVDLACRIVRDRCAAEDIVQEAFLRLIMRRGVVMEASLPGLVFTSVRNLSADCLRRRSSASDYRRHCGCLGQEGETREYSDVAEWVERGIGLMPDQMARVYRMNIYGDKRVSEISCELGMNYKTVEHILGCARKKIRGYLRRLA